MTARTCKQDIGLGFERACNSLAVSHIVRNDYAGFCRVMFQEV